MRTALFCRTEIRYKGDLRDVHVLYCPALDFSTAEFATAIKDDIDLNLQPDDLVIIARDTELNQIFQTISGSTEITSNLERLQKATRITYMSFDANGYECRRLAYSDDILQSDIPLDILIRPIITSIFNKYNGFVESSPGFHFRNPSKKHTDRFLRLSNILYEWSDISFIAIGLLKYLKGKRKIYIDTASVFCIVSALNEHLNLFNLSNKTVQASNFRSYHALEENSVMFAPKSLCLISASTSGGLGRELARKHRLSSDSVVHVLYLGKEGSVNSLCILNFHKDLNVEGVKNDDRPVNYSDEACPLCQKGSTRIQIFGDQFDPPPPQLDPIGLLATDAPADLKEVMAKFAGSGAFAVGLGSRGDPVPRLYNVDVEMMLTCEPFKNDLDYVVRRSVPLATKYVVHLDKRSKPLVDRVVESFAMGASQPEVLSRDELHRIPEGTTDPVVVVAAVIESGRSLLEVSRDLRSACRSAPLSYIVGVNKSTGLKRREGIRSNLGMSKGPVQNDVVFIESLVLPTSSESNSWSNESEFWKRLQHSNCDKNIKSWIDERIQKLNDSTTKLIDDLFIHSEIENKLKLQPGFVFAQEAAVDKYQQADVFFTISSVLQRLRAGAEELGNRRAIRSNWSQQTLLAPSNFSRFSDGVIQASFLRAAYPAELNYRASEQESEEMGRIIARIVRSGAKTRGESAAEFLISLASRRMSLGETDLKKVIAAIPNNMPFLQLIGKAIDRDKKR
jgi:hypothetical protein